MQHSLLEPWTYTVLRWGSPWHVGLRRLVVVWCSLLIGLGTRVGRGITWSPRVGWWGFIAWHGRSKAWLGRRWTLVILDPDTGYGDVLVGAVNVEEGEGGWVGAVTEGCEVILVDGNLEFSRVTQYCQIKVLASSKGCRAGGFLLPPASCPCEGIAANNAFSHSSINTQTDLICWIPSLA